MAHQPDADSHGHLPRLPPGYYRDNAYVHWSLTIAHRQQGWLKPIFYYKFRELLTHTMFRYGLCCPVFCCMPDHIHLLWIGLLSGADQLVAMKYFRKHVNEVLSALESKLQKQPFDHVLNDDERKQDAFEALVEYIARNPERAKLVPRDGFAQYPYTSSLIPGYPELKIFQEDYWPRFWRASAYLKENGFSRLRE